MSKSDEKLLKERKKKRKKLKIPAWIVKDSDKYKDLCLFFEKPILDGKQYKSYKGCAIITGLIDFDIKPGEIVPVTISAGEESNEIRG